ncbi:LysR family transcriptional regulator [Rhizobium sp. MC63]|uniref:LysR family transcriptional regulator n=1 Tax=Rhizobium mulingense TaxID=3031128 RepID=A0ACC6MSF3_9HYPH|nr:MULTISPECIES: LysR family transcriptional regulator [unclassified Rhizobium]MDF0695884.1 LysR family transcriptional regulator [Rhizobium sp. MC63]MEA3516294.1 LysR family transcriptional regulator [Rhizobium sp. MJ31]
MADRDDFVGLDERAIFYFLCVYEHGSLRSAAEALGLTPSAIGRKIQILEHQIGYPLLNRDLRGSKPTPAADLLAKYLKDRNKRDRQVLHQINEHEGLESGEIAISTGEGFAQDMMETVLADFMIARPGIRVKVTIGTTEEIIKDLLDNRADVAFAYNANRTDEIEIVAECSDPLCAYVHESHPLAGKGEAYLSQLTDYPSALHSKSSGIRAAMTRFQNDEGITPRIQFETSSLQLLKSYVEKNIGITFLPASAGTFLFAAEIKRISLIDAAFDNAKNQLMLHRGRAHSGITMQLIGIAREKMITLRTNEAASKSRRTHS